MHAGFEYLLNNVMKEEIDLLVVPEMSTIQRTSTDYDAIVGLCSRSPEGGPEPKEDGTPSNEDGTGALDENLGESND